MLELVDRHGWGPCVRMGVKVRFLSGALYHSLLFSLPIFYWQMKNLYWHFKSVDLSLIEYFLIPIRNYLFKTDKFIPMFSTIAIVVLTCLITTVIFNFVFFRGKNSCSCDILDIHENWKTYSSDCSKCGKPRLHPLEYQ